MMAQQFGSPVMLGRRACVRTHRGVRAPLAGRRASQGGSTGWRDGVFTITLDNAAGTPGISLDASPAMLQAAAQLAGVDDPEHCTLEPMPIQATLFSAADCK